MTIPVVAISFTDVTIALYVVYLFSMIALSVSIMLENRNPSATIAYLLTLIFLPILGLVIYLIFGQNFRKRRIFSRKIKKDHTRLKEWEDQHNYNFKELQNLGLIHFHDKMKIARLLMKNNRAVLTANNNIDVLTNGPEAFSEFYRCFENARHHIHVDMYIVRDDAAGKRFVDTLVRKAEEGVEVRLSYDDVGSSISKQMLHRLREAGAEVFAFMPVQFPSLTSNINYRNHKKIIVVDGEYGFVGGMNISEKYTNTNPAYGFWRDTHLKLTGDAVWSLQILFLLNWAFVSGKEMLTQAQYFPDVKNDGQKLVQIIESGPDSPWSAIMQGMFTAISTARDYVYLQTPYFIPNDEIATALETAALSGVKVKIMIPYKGDSRIVQAATFSYLKPIVDAGGEVYLYKKGMLHAKTLMVDGNLCSVGTTNLDYRSFDLNFEVNAFIYDLETTEKLVDDFNKDLADCEQLEMERWQKRRHYRKLTESLARIFAPLL